MITQLGLPTVLAGVLLWFLLTHMSVMIHEARATQMQMHAELVQIEKEFDRCCPKR